MLPSHPPPQQLFLPPPPLLPHRKIKTSGARDAIHPTSSSATATTTTSLSPATFARRAAATGPKVALSATFPSAAAAGKTKISAWRTQPLHLRVDLDRIWSESGVDLERICSGSGTDLDEAGVVDHATARQQRGGRGSEGAVAGKREQGLDGSGREEKQREERVDERELDDEVVVDKAVVDERELDDEATRDKNRNRNREIEVCSGRRERRAGGRETLRNEGGRQRTVNGFGIDWRKESRPYKCITSVKGITESVLLHCFHCFQFARHFHSRTKAFPETLSSASARNKTPSQSISPIQSVNPSLSSIAAACALARMTMVTSVESRGKRDGRDEYRDDDDGRLADLRRLASREDGANGATVQREELNEEREREIGGVAVVRCEGEREIVGNIAGCAKERERDLVVVLWWSGKGGPTNGVLKIGGVVVASWLPLENVVGEEDLTGVVCFGKLAVEKAHELGVEKVNQKLEFAQLYGMSEALSYGLSNARRNEYALPH
ncbi:hypothetical protein LR48_Vigan08g002500 [Vigna angularis]|uniref:Uncharacterized protein n=1 Tax=Phaseolus angularis TaxID=3914 RepID=A0A0L9V2C7_PHAAN|nr:hypothetical protein LR48_Vigan08g002500 [Vigna angularis]